MNGTAAADPGPGSVDPQYAGTLDRPRLTALLNRIRGRRLTVLTAGAGYGKTTLLRSWRPGVPVAEHTLTSADRTPGTLARHVVDVLRLQVPDLSADLVVAASRLRGQETDEVARAEASAAALAEALDGALRRPVVLVLDGVEHITGAPGAAEFVGALTRHAPARIHVVLSGREPPPLRTTRLRAHGDATVIGPAELAFDLGETADLVQSRVPDADDAAVRRVQAVTGGWPVAVRLVAEGIATSSSLDELLASVEAPESLLVAYLADEVMGGEQPEILAGLARVALLDDVDVALAQAIGIADPARLLEVAMRRGVYLEPRTGSPGRYVLTPLCRAYLDAWHPNDPVEVRAARTRAAEVLEESGQIRDALAYRVSLGDTDICRRLLTDHGVALVAGGHPALVVEAVAAVANPGPALDLLAGDAWTMLGDWDAALLHYGRAAPDGETAPAAVTWRTGLLHYLTGDLTAAAAAFGRGDLNDPDLADRALLLGWTAVVTWVRGDIEACRGLAVEALAVARRSGDHRALANAHTINAMVAAVDGDPNANDAHYLAGLDHATAAHDVLQLARIHTNRSSRRLENRDPEGALVNGEVALRLADLAGYATFRVIALANRGEALIALGRLDEALAELEASLAEAERMGSPRAAYPLSAIGRIHVIRGDHRSARLAYERAVALATKAQDAQALVPARCGLALEVAEEDPERALTLLDLPDSVGRSMSRGAVEIAQAWIHLRTDDAHGVRDATSRAREHALRHGDMWLLAQVEELDGVVDRDAGKLRDALALWEECGAPFEAARTRLALAELDEAAGAELAEQIRTEMEAIGAHDLAGRAGQVAARMGPTAVPDVLVRCFGGFAVVRDGVVVRASDWPSRKARDLLKMLICRAGRPIVRDQIVEHLWPDDAPAKTANRLSVALSTIRTMLDPDRLRSQDHHVVVDGDAVHLRNVEIDMTRFLAHARTGLDLSRRGEHRPAWHHLDAAERLYVGDLFEEDPYQEWAVDAREQCRLTYLGVVRRLVDGAADSAIRTRYLLRLLERDPYDENAALDLVAQLAADGRYGEARRHYRLYGRRMEEIDVEAAPYPAPSGAAAVRGGAGIAATGSIDRGAGNTHVR